MKPPMSTELAPQPLSAEELVQRRKAVRKWVLLRGILLGALIAAWWIFFAPDTMMERDRTIILGFVVGVVATGSYLFNLLAVLGAAGLASGNVAVSNTALRVDLPVMLLSTAILVPVFWNGFVISRLEGAILFTGYAGYLAYLVLDAAEHDATAIVELLALVVVPVVVVLFSVAGYRGWRRERRSGEPELLTR